MCVCHMSLKDLLTYLIFKMQLKYSVLQYTLTLTSINHCTTCLDLRIHSAKSHAAAQHTIKGILVQFYIV